MYTDGAARGNPGPAAVGVVVLDSDQRPLTKISRFLGCATNNQAEYAALIAGLEVALELKANQVVVAMDSELVARQMAGAYRVKSPNLTPLYLRARELASRLGSVSFRLLPRSMNAEADKLANWALDHHSSKQ